jgi:hypothetical protein
MKGVTNMDERTKRMVREWLASFGGDTEKTAQYIRRMLGRNRTSTKEARELVAEAVRG